jgi:hypothetical protein
VIRKYLPALASSLLLVGCVACVGALQGGTIGSKTPPTTQTLYSFGLVACGVPVAPDAPCPLPVPGAIIEVNAGGGQYLARTADANGYAMFVSYLPFSDVKINAPGFEEARANLQPPSIHGQNVSIPMISTFPAPPSRAEMLDVHITFQGLTVNCPPYGDLPWFEAVLAWATPECRANAYAAKHASTAWAGGDTHALIALPSGPPLYDEPRQPYSADRFGALDWTAGNTHVGPQLADLIADVARHGFNRILLFLGGDDGERGFPIAMAQLDAVHDALASSAYGDLRPYVVVLPGWDGVFYGYTPQHIFDWGAKCRGLFVYCGIEHSTGHIPTGEGDGDWTGSGRMRAFDLLLSEFDDARFDDSVWQIEARLLGPAYHRPPEQPAADDPGAPFAATSGQFYLRQPTERGPIVACAFEFYEYTFVRHGGGPAAGAMVQTSRDYFKRIGATCGG